MYNHAPPGYECPVCKVVAGDTGDNVVITENEGALALVSRRVWASWVCSPDLAPLGRVVLI